MDDSGSDKDNHSDNGNESNNDAMQGQEVNIGQEEGEVLVINCPVEEVEPRAQRVRLNHPNVIPHDAHTSLNP